MKKTNMRDAYRTFNREQLAIARWRREMARIGARVDELQLELEQAVARQRVAHEEQLVREYTESLFRDVAFNRVLARFTGHTPHGWEMACGCDGRMKALLRNPCWGVLKEVIYRTRIAKGIIRPCKKCDERLRPDATLALKIQLNGL